MESKKDERTWKDIDSVKLHRVKNVRSTEDRSVDAKSYIEASGLESALKDELSKVLSPLPSFPKKIETHENTVTTYRFVFEKHPVRLIFRDS